MSTDLFNIVYLGASSS